MLNCSDVLLSQAAVLDKIRASRTMTSLPMIIPDGLVVLTSAFKEALSIQVPEGRTASIAELDDFRQKTREGLLAKEVTIALESFLEETGRQSYSVRSSAVGEDSAISAFAGQFQTKLYVPGTLKEVEQAVREVWASAFTEAAPCHEALVV